nr:EamA family transporter [Segatella buccae]
MVVLFQGHSDRRCLQSGPIDKLSVVFTIIFAFLFLHDRVGLPVVIGAILIAAGSILMLSK